MNSSFIKKEVLSPQKIKQSTTPSIKQKSIKKEKISPISTSKSVKKRTSHDLSDSDSCDDAPQRKDNTSSGDDSNSSDLLNYADRISSSFLDTSSTSKSVRSSILESVVSYPSHFDTVQEPGPLTVRDVKNRDDYEYYIVRFPKDMVDADELVNSTTKIGGKSTSRIHANGKTYQMSNYDGCSLADDVVTMFLPDVCGTLKQMDMKIAGHLIIKDDSSGPTNVHQINIENLYTRPHSLPDIKVRNFFKTQKSKPQKLVMEKTPKEKKKKDSSKKRKRESEGNFSFNEKDQTDSLPPAKKKKKRQNSPILFELP